MSAATLVLRRTIRVGVGLLLSMSVLSAGASWAVYEAPDGPAPAKQYATEDLGLAHRLAVGLGAVFLIAVAGWVAVLVARRYGAIQPLAGSGAGSQIKVLAVRRVTAKLTVVAIQVSEDRAVLIADNGQAISTLGEIPVATVDRRPK